jgi:hypothetical protein
VFAEVGFTYVQKYSYFTLNPSTLGEILNSDILSQILTAVKWAIVFMLGQTCDSEHHIIDASP